jgi:hypothetical protein
MGNYSVVRIDWGENSFTTEEASQLITTKLQDVLEKNNYYIHNLLMGDMSKLVRDSMML